MERNALAAREYSRSSVLASMDSVVCPKPRRLGGHYRPPLGRHTYHTDTGSTDLKAGAELLDMIGGKVYCALGRFDNQVSSPPFYCGSPPSRVSNPIVQDEHFGTGRFGPKSPVAASPTSASSARKGWCLPTKFNQKPAMVRIEGFSCLAQDTQHSSIFAVA